MATTKYAIRPMLPEERNYSYSSDGIKDVSPMRIGHVRADFGTSGNEFWHTWWPGSREDLNNQEFKDDLTAMIDSLREKGNFLENRQALARFCAQTPEADMGDDRQHGMRVDTEKYTYFLRLSPYKGDYNLYCYCFLRADLPAGRDECKGK